MFFPDNPDTTQTDPGVTGQSTDEDVVAPAGMSQAMFNTANDIASEKNKPSQNDQPGQQHADPNQQPFTINQQNASGDDSPNSDDINTESAPYNQPSNQGQQSISGSEPDPTSDDDTLEAAQAVGEQLDEDPEHPKELDLGSDIDKAEEALRTH